MSLKIRIEKLERRPMPARVIPVAIVDPSDYPTERARIDHVAALLARRPEGDRSIVVIEIIRPA